MNERPSTLVESIFRLQELADYIVPFGIRAVCDLRVADCLVGGPRSVGELAAVVGAHEGSLFRVLRALACKGIFTEVEPGVFGLTPLADLLRSDHPLSLAEAYPLMSANFRAWSEFDHTLRTGESAFEHVFGTDYYAYLATSPRDSARYDGIQRAGTRLELRAMLRAIDWGRFDHVVDVGGNNGAFLAGLLARHKHMRGTLLDLPHAVGAAPALLAEAGVGERCEVVAGSFFDGVPAGADAYVLKRVLYDWPDDRAGDLLDVVRAAMRPDSRLLLLDPVIQPADAFDVGKIYDLLSLAMLAGKARTREEVIDLLDRHGLTVTRVVETPMFPIVEAALRAPDGARSP
ncbi:methyltransferase [Luedemannella helvata]